MRLLLVGAFAYPHSQGSQVYFQEQAIALRAAGAEVELLTYGAGREPASGGPAFAPEDPSSRAPSPGDPERWRGLDGFVSTSLPAWAAPSSRRSGPRPGKPFADLCLALALRRIVAESGRLAASSTASWNASGTGSDRASSRVKAGLPGASWGASSRAMRSATSARETTSAPTPPARPAFDAILAHHAEAALLAFHALPRSRPPVVYCAHTLLEQELPEYFKSPRRSGLASIAALGRVIDRRISARADAWIALTQSASRVISASTAAPGRRLAPPIPDAGRDPERRDCEAVARAHGLRPGAFFLYSGNLDPYQDLPLLEQVAWARRSGAAAGRREQGPAIGALPIVVATHDPRAERFTARADSTGAPGLLIRRVRTAAEARALLGVARASLVPRRTLGGFPIKLANSLAAGIPVVALHDSEWGLVDGRDALIGSVDDPVASICRALARLEQDPDLTARLGAGARATWQAQHDPARVAAETLALVASLRGPG